MSFRFAVSSLALALCVAGLSGCGNKEAADASSGTSQSGPAAAQDANKGANSSKGGSRPTQVSVTMTRMATVPLVLEAQGNVIALDDVEVRPQKNGTVQQIHFKEGDEVKRGQLLFTLDARDDVANVKRLDANVAGAQAAATAAQRDLERSQDLATRNFLSPAALDASRDKLDAANAALTQNKAAVEQARVSLSYTYVRAPFDGRAGLMSVRVGSLVTSSATSTAMVKITRMNPIGVTFSLPERDLPALLNGQRQGAVKVRVDLDAEHSLNGEVRFIDSSVDRTSGTIAVKAKLQNEERRVWPGQYMTVKIVTGEIKNAVVLPAQAVINGPNGRLVYVVKDDQTVAAQPVEVVRIVDQNAVLKGIDANVKVVLEGGQNLRPGAKVQETKGGAGGGKGDGRGRSGDQSGPRAAQTPPVAGAGSGASGQ
jgi:RND family efflux transporter MFP subunit